MRNTCTFARQCRLCYRYLMRKLLLLLMFCATCVSVGTAAAQFISQRFLPGNGERGTLGAPQDFPLVRIGNAVLLLTPGARIYDRENRTILHGQLEPGSDVVFSRDQSGYVQRIYILTDQEREILRQAGKR